MLFTMREAAVLMEAIDDAAFWDSEPWPETRGLDGFTACFEARRDGRACTRVAWSPDALSDHPARPLFDALAHIRCSTLRWWRRRSLQR